MLIDRSGAGLFTPHRRMGVGNPANGGKFANITAPPRRISPGPRG